METAEKAAVPKPPPKLLTVQVLLGMDPEFWFMKNGKVIGAEKIIPLGGIPVLDNWNSHNYGMVIIDGVQAEINVTPYHCRQSLAGNVKMAFESIAKHLEGFPGVTVSMTPLVKVDKKELNSLSDRAQQFGCAPSLNIYGEQPIEVDPSKYLFRGAGGHMHFGFSGASIGIKEALTKTPEKTVALLDLVLGNTAVLLDRDPGNIERRKVYGRAGEYRLPAHGLEYRSLSNWWLRDYKLMSFAYSLARQALAYSIPSQKARYDELMATGIDMSDIQRAINTNDFDLALKNFNLIAPVLTAHAHNGYHALAVENLASFRYLIEVGINKYFNKDLIAHWRTCSTASGSGWESWSNQGLELDRIAAQKTIVAVKAIISPIKKVVRSLRRPAPTKTCKT